MNASAAIAFAPLRTTVCAHCDESPAVTFRTRDEIAAELATRDAFFASRLERHFSRDVTNVLLGTPAEILRCDACGILIRDGAPDDEAFREDRYERAVLESLHAVHTVAFREKEADYRGLLPSGARIAEVGSYVGGFLEISRQWGWQAFGVDIGRDTSRFSQSLGFDVRSEPLEQCGFERASFDAVFIWNCFEQLAAPRVALIEARRILRRSGVLVLRVPDAGFYAQSRSVAALATNGLLGWPHRFGFDAAALRRLAAEHGFVPQRVLRATAIGPLLRPYRALGWLELTFRKG
jgi:SAM-dependent methyltransferase